MSEMTVGCIQTTATPPLSGGIYETLLEKAQRELENMQDQRDLAMRMAKDREKERDEARKLYNIALNEEARATKEYFALCKERDQWKEESLEQARLLGMGSEREARLMARVQELERELAKHL